MNNFITLLILLLEMLYTDYLLFIRTNKQNCEKEENYEDERYLKNYIKRNI